MSVRPPGAPLQVRAVLWQRCGSLHSGSDRSRGGAPRGDHWSVALRQPRPGLRNKLHRPPKQSETPRSPVGFYRVPASIASRTKPHQQAHSGMQPLAQRNRIARQRFAGAGPLPCWNRGRRTDNLPAKRDCERRPAVFRKQAQARAGGRAPESCPLTLALPVRVDPASATPLCARPTTISRSVGYVRRRSVRAQARPRSSGPLQGIHDRPAMAARPGAVQ